MKKIWFVGKMVRRGARRAALSVLRSIPLWGLGVFMPFATACGHRGFEDATPPSFDSLLSTPVVLLDVRTPSEYDEGHIDGAMNIDQGESDFVERVESAIPQSKTIAIYCRSGRRSASAAGRLTDAGYKCVNLVGGIKAWHTYAEERPAPVVETRAGRVQGIRQEGTNAFLGIPYATVERFMPPKEVPAWTGVRQCDHWGPQVMQPTPGRRLSEAEMSEENSCVLNVWTTDLAARKPVMLWIHGGGFDSGASTWNPGMGLAKKDVVVVSLNHRLNILGFLDLSACSPKYKYSANVGMLDIVAALRWIRDNISQFGGDPSNVTIFGESGGGGKVGTLLCMPSAKGLFHKAIIMSGTILNINTQRMSQDLGQAVLEQLHISPSEIEKIKDVPYDTLYAAGQRAMAASVGTRKPGTPMMWGFGPSPDGEVLLQQPFQPGFASISDDVPIMIGTTFNELQRLRYGESISEEQAREMLEHTFGSDTEAYIAAMRQAWPEASTADWLSIDWLFRPKTLLTADAIAESRRARTYMYMFTWRSPLHHGSVHGAELMFCFNTLHLSKRELPQPTAADVRLADVMSSAWAQFAHTGDPNTEGLPAWEPYEVASGATMIFDYKTRVRNNPDRGLEEIIDRHCFEELRRARRR